MTPVPIRLVVLDIDGTLLGAGREVSPRTRQAVLAVQHLGVQVALCTGRPAYGCHTVLPQLGLDHGGGIFCDGADVRSPGTGGSIGSFPLDQDVAAGLVGFAREHRLPLELYTDGALWASAPAPGLAIQAARLEIEPRFGDLDALVQRETILKAGMVLEGSQRSLSQELAGRWGVRLHVGIARSPFAPDADFLNLTREGAGKGRALDLLRDHLGLPREAVLAIGDSWNDLPLLQSAGIGVAMGNAVEELRDEADWVTAHLDQDGVAVALERFVLAA